MSSVFNQINGGSYDVESHLVTKGCDHEMEPGCESCQIYYAGLLHQQSAEISAVESFKIDAYKELNLIEKRGIREKVFDVALAWGRDPSFPINSRHNLTRIFNLMKDVSDILTVNTSAFDQTFSSLTIPLLKTGADMLTQFSTAITTGGYGSIQKLLTNSSKVSSQLMDTAKQMEAMQGRANGKSTNSGELGGVVERIELLTWLGTLPALKQVAKCRMVEGTGFELVIFYKSDVIQINSSKMYKNAFEEFDTPPWLVECLQKLQEVFDRPEWSPISNSQFMQIIGAVLRGWQ